MKQENLICIILVSILAILLLLTVPVRQVQFGYILQCSECKKVIRDAGATIKIPLFVPKKKYGVRKIYVVCGECTKKTDTRR